MKLYDLVKFRQRLHDEYSVQRSVTELTQVVNQLTDLNRDLDPRYAEYVHSNIDAFTDIIQQVQQQHGTLSTFIEQLDQHIELVTYELFSGAYSDELNSAMMNHEHRMSRIINLPDMAKDSIISRIRRYSDFHYLGMELGPRTGELTSYMVACDPLYIVDLDDRFLDQTLKQFPELYQTRVYRYIIDIIPDFSIFPKSQFGFIFSYDYFNYLSSTTIDSYLQGLYDLLRPGGVLMFTYNDGETPNGAAYAETRWHSYVPKSKLIELVKQKGFEIINTESFDSGAVNWIELQRPGEIIETTSKNIKAVGEIRLR